MAVDSATTIAGFDTAKPDGGVDPAAELDNNLRHIKTVVKNAFPAVAGAVSASDVELSYVDGVTSNIQTQINTKGAKAGQVWTGAQDFTGATVTVPTATLGAHPTTLAQTQALVITATAPTWAPTTTAVSKTLAAFEFCRVTASGQTLTFPASPTGGVTRIAIEFASGITGTLDPGSAKIKGSAGTMTCNKPGLTLVFTYLDSTVGWVVGA